MKEKFYKVVIYIDGLKIIRYFKTNDTSELHLRNAGENILADVLSEYKNITFTKVSTTVTEIEVYSL